MSANPTRALKQAARPLVRMLRQTYRKLSTYPRHRDVDLQIGVTVNVDMWHRNWANMAKNRSHELDVEKFIADFLQPGDVALDVGAQIGMFTSIAAQLIAPGGQLYSFEPDATNHADLLRTVDRNELDNVDIVNLGLSDSEGEVTFHRPVGAWGSFMDGGQGGASVTEGYFSTTKINTFSIQVTTIDAFVASRGLDRLDLIKIDVDGPEVTILRGASETMTRLKPAIMVEASMWFEEHGATVEDLFEILTAHGYEIHGTIRNGETAVRMHSAADISGNLGEKGSAMNFFCHVPGSFDDRWAGLWFMKAPAA